MMHSCDQLDLIQFTKIRVLFAAESTQPNQTQPNPLKTEKSLHNPTQPTQLAV